MNDELEALEKLTKRASTVANVYRTCLLSSMVIFLSLTLLPSVLDVVLPQNETRPRQQLFNVNYLFFDSEDYYYSVYLQLSWSTLICVTIIATVDSLYIIVIHHASGMFVVCGKQFQKATEMADMIDGNEQFNRFRRCMVSHNKALQFYEILNETSTNSYLFQVGINMIGISVTAVQLILNLDRPEEATKAGVLLVSKQFHLFVISLPGQVLLDHCAELETNMYHYLIMFQEVKGRCSNVYDIPYCKMLRKYLLLFGQDPYQGDGIRTVLTIVMVTLLLGVIIPTSFQLHVSLLEKDMDAVIECMPHLIASMTTIVKILNGHLNKENFRKLYQLMIEEWELLKLNDELHVLDKVIEQGSKLANLYRSTLLGCLGVFLTVPLIAPGLDIIVPLNETRPRQQIFRVNYLIFDEREYFFIVYFQLAIGAFIIVSGIVTIDSLYMIIIHYNSGLFAVCGYQIQKATEKDYNLVTQRSTTNNHKHADFKRCVITHHKALQFYEILKENSTNSYLLQIGLNMIGISVTAVQTVLNMDTDSTEEAIRNAIFLGAEQFHLFVISLPGQVLIDHCSDLAVNIYNSNWYKTPVKIQRMVYLMQIRANKLCVLTAGGLYQMNMENFASAFRMCMSYITMLLSLRE
ncbi:uncharacterized protein LOC117602304 [Osmia lignaria lignaria]|uniref:uncharacterized protein LOC117602304 n=1 Tax=Osmia lignaria lignaria TaxID=1437193 RepID=UPI00402B9A63